MTRFEVDAATIVPSFLGWFCARVLPLFLTVIFMVPFRLVIAPEIACFIGSLRPEVVLGPFSSLRGGFPSGSVFAVGGGLTR